MASGKICKLFESTDASTSSDEEEEKEKSEGKQVQNCEIRKAVILQGGDVVAQQSG